MDKTEAEEGPEELVLQVIGEREDTGERQTEDKNREESPLKP